MQVIKITTDNEMSIVEVPEKEGFISAITKEINGFAEIVRPYGLRTINTMLSEETGKEERLVMIVDEEGHCKMKKINVVGTILCHDNIAGDILICEEVYKEGIGRDIAPLTEDKASKICKLLKYLFNNLKINVEINGGSSDGTDGT